MTKTVEHDALIEVRSFCLAVCEFDGNQEARNVARDVLEMVNLVIDGEDAFKGLRGKLEFEYGKEVLEAQIHEPKWEETSRVHDWRSYIPEEVRKIWTSIGYLGRRVIIIICENAAGREEWE